MSRSPRSGITATSASLYTSIFVIGPILCVIFAVSAGGSLHAWVSTGVSVAVVLSVGHLIAWATRRPRRAGPRARGTGPAQDSL